MAQRKSTPAASVRAVDRALDILLAFTSKDVELTVGELLARVRLSRPTLYRLLYTLEKAGFIVAVGDPQRFRLGPAVGKLAGVWTSTSDVAAVAEPILKKAWSETGETVGILVPQGTKRLCVAELPSAHPLSFKRGVGHTEHLARGASGRAILAYLNLDRRELASYVRGTGVNTQELEAELTRTRKRGYAISRNELIEGAVAVAAPFFYRSGRIAGSMAIFGPEARCNEARIRELVAQVMKYAGQLSEALGA